MSWILLGAGFQVTASDLEPHTSLMESTFKLWGEGSCGTGFILSVPAEEDSESVRHILVTARHVLENIQGDSVQIILRNERGDGKWEELPYWVRCRQDGRQVWIGHEDETVDVAAMRVRVPRHIRIPLVSPDALADDQFLRDAGVHPGDELLCLGYPLCAASGRGEFAILRSGRVASYPLIPTRRMKTFLYDFEILNGHSGGPVYLIREKQKETEPRYREDARWAIVGLVSREATIPAGRTPVHAGSDTTRQLRMAQVVHASLIRETIERLVTTR
ncbi:hypothetical protein AMJ40_00205 [candidate division TA06 bacterium DG_26]|uniref:Peptidase S1 domain-containing protein n=1 Tax=candidate division TA06 bacterium DG_26 TaxID=1703771 RepID=A0A0S7WMF1_UNCT6|nr:MAG: hypothetical protein AMJ40_00205 [candidate division TA06 bacterium DG_26]